MASLSFGIDLSKCIQPPTSDDPKVDQQLQKTCEEDLKRKDFIQKNKQQMKETAEKACAPDCEASEKRRLSEMYQLYCSTYCQNVVPENLIQNISCGAQNMCSWTDPTKHRKWKDLATHCLSGAKSGGEGFVSQVGELANQAHMAPRRLGQSITHFSKTVWNKGFHQAINNEAIATEKVVKDQVKKIKGFPEFLSEQHETLKCLDSKVAEEFACQLGTVILLDSLAGGSLIKLLNASTKASIVKKASENVSRHEKAEAASTPSKDALLIDPNTGLPILPDEAIRPRHQAKKDSFELKPASSSSKKDFWDTRSEAIAKSDQVRLREASPAYREALKKSDSHAKFLEKAGYNFEPGKEKPASLKALGGLYHSEIERKAKQLGIPDEDILIASSPFKLPNGEVKFIKIGDEIPKGAMPESVDLTDRQFIELVASGKFPLSEGEPYSRMALTIKEHDAAHLSSFVDHPEAMAELAKQTRKLKTSGAIQKHYGKPEEVNFDPVSLRVYAILETSSYYDQKSLSALKSKVPTLREGQVVQPKDLKSTFSKMDQGELSKMITQVDEIQNQNTRHFGGASRDVIHRSINHPAHDLNRVHQNEIEIKKLKNLREQMIKAKTPHESRQIENQIKDSLSKVTATQWNFSQVNPKDMIKGAFEHNSLEGQRLREIYCASHGVSKDSDVKIKKSFSCSKWF